MRRILQVAAVGLAFLLSAAPGNSQEACTCETVGDQVCVSGPTGNGFQAFEVTLISFDIDQGAGSSQWVYEICDKGPLDPNCPSDKSLSHFDILLGDLFLCLAPENEITFEKLGDTAGDGADLSCVVQQGDPACSPNPAGQVAKCDVVDTNPLDPGDCVQMRLTIAGETAQLGVGATQTQSKAGPDCTDGSCILGPSCEPCNGEPPEDMCLTRTPGFWGTHPHITDLFLDPPVTVCGEELIVTAAGTCDSATEAMCVSPGRESKTNRAYAQLVRQLTAAKLNLAATAEIPGGFCGSSIGDRILACEELCGENQRTISGSGCIEDLAAFNESEDTVDVTPAPFDSPGPADPTDCREANGNGILIGAGGCSP